MKSAFLSQLTVKDKTGENADYPSIYTIDSLGFASVKTKITIWVPKGFHSDSASIPRFLWGIYPSWGRWNRAAVVHDWLYTVQVTTREEADSVFLDALEVCGVPWIRRRIFHSSVRVFGGRHWAKWTPEQITENRENAHKNGGGVFPCSQKS